MSYKVTEDGNIATIHLDGEIDMDVTERAKDKNTKVELKEVSQPVEKVLAMARKFL